MTDSEFHLLIVDDDQRLLNLLESFLRKHDYRVTSVESSEDMYKVIENKWFDLIILDLMLPGDSGLEALNKLRTEQKNDIPIIMLTAKGDETSRVEGLELGADDYLSKPFNPQELLARIKAVLKRSSKPVLGSPSNDQNVAIGKFTLYFDSRKLSDGKNSYLLTTSEFAILRALVSHAGEPLTRDKLMHLAYGREWNAIARSIDVQISRLRKILEDNPAKPRYIQTVWGTGYVFMP